MMLRQVRCVYVSDKNNSVFAGFCIWNDKGHGILNMALLGR